MPPMILSRLLIPATLLVSIPLVGSLPSLAQIASPSNAGQNSGNNTSGSSSTPISTPNFSPVTAVSTTSTVSVTPDGTVTASPGVVTAVDASIVSTVATEQASILSAVVAASPAAALSGPEALVPDVSVGIAGSTAQELVSLAQLPQSADPLVSVGQTISVSRLSNGASGTIQINESSIVVSTQGQAVEIPSTQSSSSALVEFASVAIAVGLAPPTIGLGAQLVTAGATASQAVVLMASLQGLANQASLTSLSNGINAFNAIVNTASPAAIANLAANPVFVAASATLRAARAVLSAAG